MTPTNKSEIAKLIKNFRKFLAHRRLIFMTKITIKLPIKANTAVDVYKVIKNFCTDNETAPRSRHLYLYDDKKSSSSPTPTPTPTLNPVT